MIARIKFDYIFFNLSNIFEGFFQNLFFKLVLKFLEVSFYPTNHSKLKKSRVQDHILIIYRSSK